LSNLRIVALSGAYHTVLEVALEVPLSSTDRWEVESDKPWWGYKFEECEARLSGVGSEGGVINCRVQSLFKVGRTLLPGVDSNTSCLEISMPQF
jgi:hypothetical protein